MECASTPERQLPSDSSKHSRKRGPYKQYLLPGSQAPVPKSTRYSKRQDALDDDASSPSMATDPPDSPISQATGSSQDPVGCDLSCNTGGVPGTPSIDYDASDHFTGDDCLSDARSRTSSVTSSDQGITDEGGSGANQQASDGASSFRALFRCIIGERVVVSRGDILVMVLKYAATNSLTFTGLTNLVKMVNCFFAEPILPESRYFLGKMFDAGGATFHFYCSSCFYYVGELDASCPSFQCPHCSEVCNVSNVSDPPFFITFDVQSQLQRILSSTDFLDLTEPLGDATPMCDITDGSQYRAFVNDTAHSGRRVSFTLNADGAPIFKSSSTAIWPIQLSVNELCAKDRMSKLVLAALWFGKRKPRMEIFQKAFVDVMEKLSDTGFPLSFKGKQETFKAYCICSAVDSVARAPMQGIVQFNGYNGCNWCLHPGKYVGGSVKYPVQAVDPEERTDEQMYTDMYINLEQFSIVWALSQIICIVFC
ncbi:unnamed protein product [Ixodes pacificus]